MPTADASANRLRALVESGTVFAEAVNDVRRLLDLVAERFAALIGDTCLVRMVAADGMTLTPVATHHPDQKVRRYMRETADAIPLKVGEGIWGKVVETGVAVLLKQVSLETFKAMTTPEFLPVFQEVGVTSMIVVRLRARGNNLGFISLVRNGAGRPAYTESDLDLVQDLADRASLAIDNARLVADLGARVQELAAQVRERKAAEEQLRQSQKMEAIGRLAGGVAHDFNNLLSVVLSYTSLLLAELDPKDPMVESIREIEMAGERATGLTRQLLAFGRRQVFTPRLLDLNAVVAGMEKMIQRLVGEDVEVRTALAPSLCKARLDPNQVEQVLLNLIVNARDAMPDGGKLTLETANVALDGGYAAEQGGLEPGPHVMIAVTDTGTGMSAETRAHIFEPFFTTKEQGKGTGLGLSTVFGIVKQSGGNVWVYSEVGKGTTFKVYFPCALEAGEAAAVPAPEVRSQRGNETILLVEDEPQVRALARTLLKRLGYQVLDAENAAQALLLSERFSGDIHLLLTDVVMPQMSGRVLAEQMAVHRPALLVLYMSGYTDDTIVHHGVLDAGIHFLEKPLTPERLGTKVRQVLDSVKRR